MIQQLFYLLSINISYDLMRNLMLYININYFTIMMYTFYHVILICNTPCNTTVSHDIVIHK